MRDCRNFSFQFRQIKHVIDGLQKKSDLFCLLTPFEQLLSFGDSKKHLSKLYTSLLNGLPYVDNTQSGKEIFRR